MCDNQSCSGHRSSGRHMKSGISRRDILRYSVAGAGITALGPMVRGVLPQALGAPGPQSRLVIINLYGGNDGINTVVPFTQPAYFSQRPTIQLDPNLCLSLAGGPGSSLYKLHPVMTNLQTLWNEGAVALVNKVGYPNADLSHFLSQDYYSYGVRNGFGGLGVAPSGWVARFADLYAPTPMGAVGVGVGRPTDFIGGTSNPFLVNDLEQFRFVPDGRYPDNHLYRLEVAKSILTGFAGTGLSADAKNALLQGHDLADQVQTALTNYNPGNVVYPDSAPGAYLHDVAVLIEGGFETRLFYTGQGGYDTHGDQLAQHVDLLTDLDQAIGAFAQDMKNRGVWNQTAVVVISEFGRRNDQNGSDGTDHAEANAFMVIGGNVNGGVYGEDITDANLMQGELVYAVDFRDIFKEVLSDHLGVNPAPVFPEVQPKNTVLGIM